jgi:hypothetical protein
MKKKIEKFVGTHDPPKLNQEAINNLNRAVTKSEIETVIKNLQQNKAQDLLLKFTKQLRH